MADAIADSDASKHDWTRAVEMKLAIVQVAIAEVSVSLISDAALTAARRIRDAAERLSKFLQWATYFLFTLSIALGLYAALKGIKGLSEAE